MLSKTEILELELRLSELRNKHRNLIQQASEIENAVQAKLSSYKAALDLVNKQITSFLANPPFTDHHYNIKNAESFLHLPPKRRTIKMAQDYYVAEISALLEQKNAYDFERDALREGLVIWNDVVKTVTGVERKLRSTMQAHNAHSSIRNGPTLEKTANTQDQGMRQMLVEFSNSIELMEAHFNTAKSKGWNLLMICVGNELEAFRQGRELIEDAFFPAKSSTNSRTPSPSASLTGVEKRDMEADADKILKADDLWNGQDSRTADNAWGLGGLQAGDADGRADGLNAEAHGAQDRSEDEDEGPDPGLLVSPEAHD
jgi:hypothetical protein